MPSFMVLGMVFIVPSLIDREKVSEQKKTLTLLSCTNAFSHFSKNLKLNHKRGK